MLRCDDAGSVRSRRFAGRSDSLRVVVSTRPPIEAGLCLRIVLEDQGLVLLLVEGRFHRGCGPVERRSPMEKERRGDALSSKCATGVGNGEDDVLFATPAPEGYVLCSKSFIPLSIPTASTMTISLADISVGVCFLSAYNRRMGLGMPVEPRCFDNGSCSESTIRGEKYDRW